jgi:hypothetical protein
MKRLYSILSILLLCATAQAQPYETNLDFNRTLNWHFSNQIKLVFERDTIMSENSAINTVQASSILTDTLGNLMLYTNGENIWDSNDNIIHNGNLNNGSRGSSMGAIFVVHKKNPKHIYLFTTNYSASTYRQLSYNLIYLEQDTFRIVIKDSILRTSMSEPLAVINDENDNDIWLVSHVFNGDDFITYKITKKGLILCPIISKSRKYTGSDNFAAQTDIAFTTDGRYFAQSNKTVQSLNKSVEIYKFNKSTGEIDFLFTIDSLQFPIGGLCFNKTNKLLFITERDNNLNVFKFNPLDSFETVNSKKIISFEGRKFEMQNDVYNDNLILTIFDSTHLTIISNTENIDSVSVNAKGISLNNKIASNGLPNFNNSYFYTPSINFSYQLDCITNKAQLYGQDTFSADSHNWQITKQALNPITSNLKNPLIEFEDTGTYSISYIASNGSRIDTIIKQITILPKVEQFFLGSDTNWCVDSAWNYSIQAPNGMHCYEWNTGETTPSITVNTSGTYIAKITTPNFCVLFDTINIDVYSSPSKDFLGNDTAWCESENNSLILTAPNDMETYFWQDSSIGQTYEVNQTGSYYVTITDSNSCSSTDTIQIFIDSIPSIPNSFLGNDISWCENIDTLITISAPFGNYIYHWNTGSNSNLIQTNSAGVYFLVVSTIDGYCNIIDSIELYTNPQPDKPQIFQVNDTLKTNSISNTYIWMKNNTVIGGNQDFLKLLDTGIYALTIQNEFGCENTSDTLYVFKLNRNDISFNPIRIYPNPFNNKLLIESSIEIREVRIINVLGQLVYHNNIPSQINDIETTGLENGLYIVILRDSNQNLYTYKLIKQKE